MGKWPVDDPVKDRSTLHTNLRMVVPTVSPIEFDGPLNVLIQMYGTALAAVNSSQVKADYEGIYGAQPATAPLDDDDDETPG